MAFVEGELGVVRAVDEAGERVDVQFRAPLRLPYERFSRFLKKVDVSGAHVPFVAELGRASSTTFEENIVVRRRFPCCCLKRGTSVMRTPLLRRLVDNGAAAVV